MNAIAILAQVVQEPIGSYLVQGASVLILGLQGWSIRTTTQIDRRLLKLETAFTGINGTNGALGTIKDHAAQIADLQGERRHRARRKAGRSE